MINAENKSQINEGDTLTKNPELILDNEIDLSSISSFRIEYSMKAKDAPFSSFKLCSEIININLYYKSENI